MKTTTSFGSFLVALVAVEGVCAVPFPPVNALESSIRPYNMDKTTWFNGQGPSVAKSPAVARAVSPNAGSPNAGSRLMGAVPDVATNPYSQGLPEVNTGTAKTSLFGGKGPSVAKFPTVARAVPNAASPFMGAGPDEAANHDFKGVNDASAENTPLFNGKGPSVAKFPTVARALSSNAASPNAASRFMGAVPDVATNPYSQGLPEVNTANMDKTTSFHGQGPSVAKFPTVARAQTSHAASPFRGFEPHEVIKPFKGLPETHIGITTDVIHKREPKGGAMHEMSFLGSEIPKYTGGYKRESPSPKFSGGAQAEKGTFHTIPQGHGPVVPTGPLPKSELESFKSSLRRAAPAHPPVRGGSDFLPFALTQGEEQKIPGKESSGVPLQARLYAIGGQGASEINYNGKQGGNAVFPKLSKTLGPSMQSVENVEETNPCARGLCG